MLFGVFWRRSHRMDPEAETLKRIREASPFTAYPMHTPIVDEYGRGYERDWCVRALFEEPLREYFRLDRLGNPLDKLDPVMYYFIEKGEKLTSLIVKYGEEDRWYVSTGQIEEGGGRRHYSMEYDKGLLKVHEGKDGLLVDELAAKKTSDGEVIVYKPSMQMHIRQYLKAGESDDMLALTYAAELDWVLPKDLVGRWRLGCRILRSTLEDRGEGGLMLESIEPSGKKIGERGALKVKPFLRQVYELILSNMSLPDLPQPMGFEGQGERIVEDLELKHAVKNLRRRNVRHLRPVSGNMPDIR